MNAVAHSLNEEILRDALPKKLSMEKGSFLTPLMSTTSQEADPSRFACIWHLKKTPRNFSQVAKKGNDMDLQQALGK